MRFERDFFGRRCPDIRVRRGQRGHAGTMCLAALANKERWFCGQVRSLHPCGGCPGPIQVSSKAGVRIGGGACDTWPHTGAHARRSLGHHAHRGRRGAPSSLTHGPATPWHPSAQRPVPSPKVQSYLDCTALAARAAQVHSLTLHTTCVALSSLTRRNVFPNASRTPSPSPVPPFAF